MNIYLFSYFIIGIFAIPCTLLWSKLLFRLIKKYKEEKDRKLEEEKGQPTRVWWIPFLVGIFERAIITTMVGWNIPGTAAFIAGWTGLKLAGGWNTWNIGTRYGRSVFFVGLLGSALSIVFALFAGLIIFDAKLAQYIMSLLNINCFSTVLK